jgi:3-hydroxyisobutyrate dehydrogenase-like beta-hydroxyacid dehydrogenase
MLILRLGTYYIEVIQLKTVGFIGLGTMGLPMAENLLKKGFRLTVYNRTPEKTIDLVRLGAEAVDSPAEVARSVQVLITMVSNDSSLLEVFYGSQGIMAGLRPGLTVIDCSTVSPVTSRQLHKDLLDHYVDFLDAPVTGSKPAAIAGTLVFMVGGNEVVLNEHMDVFEAMGSKIKHMGPSGSGSYTKLAHNTIVGINALAVCEGLSIATKADIDPEAFLDIVLNGAANSRQAELKGPKIVERDFSVQFSTKLMHKDLRIASQLTSDMNVTAPMLHLAKSIFEMGLGRGFGEADLSSIVQCYEEWMGGRLIKKQSAKAASEEPVLSGRDRRRSTRVHVGIKLHLSIYQWQQEGSFSGQTIDGTLIDLSDGGLQIASDFPLSEDMFIVIHFPSEADLPPITGKVIRIEAKGSLFHYGCMLSGIPPYVRMKLEDYIRMHQEIIH